MATARPATFELGPDSNGIRIAPWEFDAADFEKGSRYELVNEVPVVAVRNSWLKE